MLIGLSIRNFALIREIDLQFGAGLNVLTGETGAGKSILIDALRLVLGERMESNQIFEKNSPCVIEAVFQTSEAVLKSEMLSSYLSPGDELLIFRREISPEGRSKATINRRLVNLSDLKEIGRLWVDIHGQYDNQKILSASSHLGFLDSFASVSQKAKFQDHFSSYQKIYERYHALRVRKKLLEERREGKERALDLLNYQIGEIEKVQPKEGEEEKLKEERIRLAYSEKLSALVSRILGVLNDEDESVSGKVSQTFRDLSEWVRIDETAKPVQMNVESLQANLEEIIRTIQDYQEGLSFDPDRLEQIDVRLDSIEGIKRKYGGSIPAALAFFECARKDRDELVNAEVYTKEIDKEIAECLPAIKKKAEDLTHGRKRAGQELSECVQKDLKDLGMKSARFECRIESVDYQPNGQDQVEFFFSANPGAVLSPMSDVASGGEASRVMLAIKRTLAQVDAMPTLIFDEIDSNIGGRLGSVVGEKLKAIAGERQVLLITHLPQIASFADRHFKVRKRVSKGKTEVDYCLLEGEEKVRELAQMMSGEKETEISKVHAKEMLKMASE